LNYINNLVRFLQPEIYSENKANFRVNSGPIASKFNAVSAENSCLR